ncbi:MAG: hypothetical protein ACKV2T_36075 [Kofleriaceae bacterium]
MIAVFFEATVDRHALINSILDRARAITVKHSKLGQRMENLCDDIRG